MSNCSDSFPSTDVFYAELSSDIPTIVFLALACVLTLAILVMFLEEHVYLQKIHMHDPIRQRRVVTLLGLYPVVSVMALLSLLVPACTQLVDLIASCYLSVCIHMFVYLMVEYFGGDEKMIAALADDKIRMNTPPCCCCCVCLPRITLTKKYLSYIKILALQVAIIRPLLLFIAAILWTDGKYVQGERLIIVLWAVFSLSHRCKRNTKVLPRNLFLSNLVSCAEVLRIFWTTIAVIPCVGSQASLTSPTSAALYISVLSGISTLLSMYGMIVIYRATVSYMKHQKLTIKFISVQMTVVLINIQTLVFGVMARYDVPPCLHSRGPKVRASNINHGVFIVEMFLLSLLARYAYRRPEPNHPDADIKSPVSGIQHGYDNDAVNVATDSNPVGHYRSYDNQSMSIQEHSDKLNAL